MREKRKSKVKRSTEKNSNTVGRWAAIQVRHAADITNREKSQEKKYQVWKPLCTKLRCGFRFSGKCSIWTNFVGKSDSTKNKPQSFFRKAAEIQWNFLFGNTQTENFGRKCNGTVRRRECKELKFIIDETPSENGTGSGSSDNTLDRDKDKNKQGKGGRRRWKQKTKANAPSAKKYSSVKRNMPQLSRKSMPRGCLCLCSSVGQHWAKSCQSHSP